MKSSDLFRQILVAALAGLAPGVLWTGAARADAAEFYELKKSYEKEVAAAVQPLREGYRKALLALEAKLAENGDYDGARQVQTERHQMEKILELPVSRPDGRAAGGNEELSGLKLAAGAEAGGGVSKSEGGWAGWNKAGGSLRWPLPAGVKGGGYSIELVYSCPSGGTLPLGIREDFHTLNRTARLEAAQEEPASLRLGTLRVRPGASFLEIRLLGEAAVTDFVLREVHLIPEEEGE